MAGTKRRLWSNRDLQNLKADEAYALLDEIPSDSESVLSDVETVMGDETANLQSVEEFDIENMDIVLADDNVGSIDVAIGGQIDNLEYESEDEIPLQTLARQLIAKKTIVWTHQTNYCTKPNPFVSTTGVNLSDNVESPMDIFLQLFPEDLIQHITFQTNLYSMQKRGGGANYTPTTDEEIKVFLGVNLLMGLKKMPSYRDYWSAKNELRDHFISSVISRDRFSWLLSNIHLNDNSVQPTKNDPNYDKLYKVRPLLSKLREKFISALEPHEFQAVDESMIRFKGRSSIRQYMPNKPIKRGYKVWVRSDASGFMCDFEIYTGKVDGNTEKNLGMRVVKNLTRTLIGKHHKVYFDNYFNSIELQRSLLSEGVYACGTFRKGRKDFPELKPDKNMKRGDIDFRVSSDGLAALKWMDRRSVLLLGNYLDPSIIEVVKRRQKDGAVLDVTCPRMVVEYNSHMGFVDKFDMLKSIYETDRKSHKWWHRIFFYFLDACVVNSFILFQQRSQSKSLTLKEFRLNVARGLIGVVEPSKRGRPSNEMPFNNFKRNVPLEVRQSKACHMPERSTKLRCALCSTSQNVSRTMWKCATCKVGLCIKHDKNCFAQYHAK